MSHKACVIMSEDVIVYFVKWQSAICPFCQVINGGTLGGKIHRVRKCTHNILKIEFEIENNSRLLVYSCWFVIFFIMHSYM